MKGLTLAIGSIILACCLQLSTAAPPAASTYPDLAYVDTTNIKDVKYISLPEAKCINFQPPITATQNVSPESEIEFYYDADCTGDIAYTMDPNQSYSGELIKSAKKVGTKS
jgi:hypothetical protein